MSTHSHLMETFNNIGFYLVETENMNIGDDPTDYNICETYRYNSPNLKDSHYTLIVYKYTQGEINIENISIDYRLYIHSNLDGKYIDSPFQTSNMNYVNVKIQELFPYEMRNIIISNILS